MFKNSNFFLDVSFQNDWWFGLSPDCPHGKKSYLKLNSFRTKRCCSVRTVWFIVQTATKLATELFFWNTKFLAVLSRQRTRVLCIWKALQVLNEFTTMLFWFRKLFSVRTGSVSGWGGLCNIEWQKCEHQEEEHVHLTGYKNSLGSAFVWTIQCL